MTANSSLRRVCSSTSRERARRSASSMKRILCCCRASIPSALRLGVAPERLEVLVVMDHARLSASRTSSGRRCRHASIQQTGTYLNATLRGLHESMRNLDSIPPRSQAACKQTRPRPPACSQAGSRQKREVLASLIVKVGGVYGTTFATGARPWPHE